MVMASFKAAALLLLISLLSSGGPPLAACTRVEHVTDGGEQIFLEAENFSSVAPAGGGCWKPGIWSENYYACTFMDGGSTFLSRKAFLGAPASLPAGHPPCVAEANATVTTGGLFAPLVRFEPLCRQPACFETQFGISVLQNGTVKFSGVFGALGSLSLRANDGTLIDHAATVSTHCHGTRPTWTGVC